MVKLGDLELFDIDETVSSNCEITDKPIENKQSITDNIKVNQIKIDLNFVVTKDTLKVRNKLENLRQSRNIFVYSGVDFVYSNMVLVNVNIPRNSDILDGFKGSLSMSQIFVAEQENYIDDPQGNDPIELNLVRGKQSGISERSLRSENIEPTDTYLLSILEA